MILAKVVLFVEGVFTAPSIVRKLKIEISTFSSTTPGELFLAVRCDHLRDKWGQSACGLCHPTSLANVIEI